MAQSAGNPVAPELCLAILELAKARGALSFGDFVLSSGQHTTYYFDGRLLTLDSTGAGLLGAIVAGLAKQNRIQAVGGPSMGADPMVGAALAEAHRQSFPLRGFLVRGETKDHGTQKLVEGPLERGSRVMVVDDVCTTGGSLFRAISAVEAEGCQVALVLTVLDRHQGGSDRLHQHGYPYVTLLEGHPSGTVRVAQ